jgi:hypothetical protein
MNVTVWVARDHFISFRFFATRCHGASAIPAPQIYGHVCRNCTDERTVGLFNMMRIFAPLRMIEAMGQSAKCAAAWLLWDYNLLYVPMKCLIIDELVSWLPTNQSGFYISKNVINCYVFCEGRYEPNGIGMLESWVH